MTKHEIKYCPRCEAPFECKAGDIAHCQCNGIHLSIELQDEINDNFADCLCRKCLLELKQQGKEKTRPGRNLVF